MTDASHAPDSIAAMPATQAIVFLYYVDAFRYLSRVFQESLPIIFVVLCKNDGQTFLEHSAEVPKFINMVNKSSHLCSCC